MSIPYNQDTTAYVVPGGEITLMATWETALGSGQLMPVSDVMLTISPVGDGLPVVGPTTEVEEIGEATSQYRWFPPQTVAAGEYQAVWTATGEWGQVTISQVITVVPLPSQSPARGLYATAAQYQNRERDFLTPVDLIEYYLQLASESMDEALIGAVYPTDLDGMPNFPEHIALFGRACCAQVAWLVANGDPQQVKQQYASTSLGGVSQTRGQKAQGQALPTLAPRAAQILHTGGVLQTAPLISW